MLADVDQLCTIANIDSLPVVSFKNAVQVSLQIYAFLMVFIMHHNFCELNKISSTFSRLGMLDMPK